MLPNNPYVRVRPPSPAIHNVSQGSASSILLPDNPRYCVNIATFSRKNLTPTPPHRAFRAFQTFMKNCWLSPLYSRSWRESTVGEAACLTRTTFHGIRPGFLYFLLSPFSHSIPAPGGNPPPRTFPDIFGHSRRFAKFCPRFSSHIAPWHPRRQEGKKALIITWHDKVARRCGRVWAGVVEAARHALRRAGTQWNT